MTNFKNRTIFGLAVKNQLSELLLDPDKALRNLNLKPQDFRVLRNIGSTTSGIPNTFQKISNTNENILLKLDSLQSETSLSYDRINRKLTSSNRNRPSGFIEGNLVMNGKLIANSINYRVFVDTITPPSFTTVPVTTATNSVWDKNNNTIKLGQALKIESTAASPGVTKIITGKLRNVKAMDARKFSSEVPTHKIQITVNGTAYYMYAIKNNPFTILGTFNDIDGDNLKIESTSTVRYAMKNNDNIGQAQTDSTIESLEDGPELKVYTNPSNVTDFKIVGHAVESLGEGIKWDNANGVQVNLANNRFPELPDFAKLFPNFKEIIFTQPDIAPFRINYSFAELKDKIPNGVEKLHLTRSTGNTVNALNLFDAGSPSIQGEPAPFDAAPFNNLIELRLQEMGIGNSGDSNQNLATPRIPSSLKVLDLSQNHFTELHAVTLNTTLEEINLERNTVLKTHESDNSPLEEHPYYKNTTYGSNLKKVNVSETKLGIPNLSNKANLEEFKSIKLIYDDRRDANSPRGGKWDDHRFQLVEDDGSNKFTGCTSLTTLEFKDSDIFGPLPNFGAANSFSSLHTLDLFNTKVINFNESVSPLADAIEDFGLPESLRVFDYSYKKDQYLDTSPETGTIENILPENAFAYFDSGTASNSTLIELDTVRYISKGITTGKFPAINAKSIDIQGNAFNDIEPFGDAIATRIETFRADDNNFNIDLNFNTLFSANEYTELDAIFLKNNSFDSFQADADGASIPTSKFPVLKTLDLTNAFRASSDTPPKLLNLPQFLNSSVETINITENQFTSIENLPFKDCDSLTDFDMDLFVGDEDLFEKCLVSIENLTLGTSSPSRDFSFSKSDRDATTRINIELSGGNPASTRVYTTTDVENFNINERIKTLNARSVSISGIVGVQTYKDAPDAPTGLELVRTSETEIRVRFDAIADVDRVIIERITADSPNFIKIGNATVDGTTVFNQTGTGQQEFIDTGADEDTQGYRIHGENTRSIISNIKNTNTIIMPAGADSPGGDEGAPGGWPRTFN